MLAFRRTRRFETLGLAVAIAAAACGRVERPPTPESRWIAARAVHFRTIDPADARLDDLEPLRAAIGDARVVLLGEQTHGEGSTFHAKTRLVRFLNERMGFDVLAIESGLFACERAGAAIRRGVPARGAVRDAVFPVWAESRQFQPLIGLLESSARTARPLALTGFDMQLTGRISREALVPALRSGASLAPGELAPFFRPLETLLSGAIRQFRATARPERGAFRLAAAELAHRLDGRRDAEGAFLAQVARSTAVNVGFLWDADFDHPVPEVMNRRDAQMAENLLWLASERYPGRKIVVWAATSHVSRRRDLIERPIPDPGMIPMGQRLSERLGSAAYVVAVTSGAGRVGSAGTGAWDLAPPRPGSFEDHAERAGIGALFLDLRATSRGSWLEKPVLARPLGQATMRAPWPEIVDAFVFVPAATPSEKVEEE